MIIAEGGISMMPPCDLNNIRPVPQCFGEWRGMHNTDCGKCHTWGYCADITIHERKSRLKTLEEIIKLSIMLEEEETKRWEDCGRPQNDGYINGSHSGFGHALRDVRHWIDWIKKADSAHYEYDKCPGSDNCEEYRKFEDEACLECTDNIDNMTSEQISFAALHEVTKNECEFIKQIKEICERNGSKSDPLKQEMIITVGQLKEHDEKLIIETKHNLLKQLRDAAILKDGY